MNGAKLRIYSTYSIVLLRVVILDPKHFGSALRYPPNLVQRDYH